jgi:hypothetical protein
VWCYKTDCTKEEIQVVAPTFQVLAKLGGKDLEGIHAQKVLYQRDFRVSPLLPTMWALIFNLRKHLDSRYFSINHYNVFKAGKILPGLIQYTLDNVHMMTDMETLYNHTMLSRIYDLKPL